MVVNSFERLQETVTDDDPAAVAKIVDTLDDALRTQRAREEGYVAQARALRGQSEVADATQETALELQQQVSEAVSARGRMLTAVDQYTTGKISASEAAATIADGIEVHKTLRDAADSFSGPTDSVPPIISVSGLSTRAILLGATFTEEIVVRNVGGTAIENVSLSLETDPTVSVELSQTELSQLGPEETTTVTVSGVPRKDTELRVDATASETSDTARGQINVRDTREVIGEGLTSIFEILRQLRAALPESTDKSSSGKQSNANGNQKKGRNSSVQPGPGRGLEAKLEAITKDLSRAFDRIEDGKPKGSIDGKLDAAVGTTEAFIQQTTAQKGKALPDSEAAAIIADAQALAETIREAQTAEIAST